MPTRPSASNKIPARVKHRRAYTLYLLFRFSPRRYRKYEKIFLGIQKKKIDFSLSFSLLEEPYWTLELKRKTRAPLNFNLETAPMIRNLGLAVAFVVLAWPGASGSGAGHNTVRLGRGVSASRSALRRIWAGIFPAVGNGGAVMDQYGMWHSVPYVPSAAARRRAPHGRSYRRGRLDPPAASRCRAAALSAHHGFFGMDRRRMVVSFTRRRSSRELWQWLRIWSLRRFGLSATCGRAGSRTDLPAMTACVRTKRYRSALLPSRREMAMRGCSKFLPTVAMVAAVIVGGFGLARGKRSSRGRRAVLGSYRVSDYLGAPGLYGMSYGFRELRNAADLFGLLGVPGAVVWDELSALRHLARPVRRRLVAAWIRRPGLCLWGRGFPVRLVRLGVVLLPDVCRRRRRRVTSVYRAADPAGWRLRAGTGAEHALRLVSLVQ